MSDLYQAPNSQPHEALPTRRYSHALIGAVSGFCFLLLVLYQYPYRSSAFDQLDTYFVPASFGACAGVTLLFFRRLRWYLALMLGPLLAVVLLFADSLVFDYLNIDI